MHTLIEIESIQFGYLGLEGWSVRNCYDTIKSQKKEKVVLHMKDSSIGSLTKTAMMAAIVFVGIYLIKVPVPNGYTHLGDCFIFLGVLLLGTKRGALAGAIGAAASDVLGGFMHWAVPTFFIKYIMAFIMGMFVDKLMPDFKWNWIVGSVAGGLMQCVLYTAFDCFMFGLAYGIAGIPSIVIQTINGIVFLCILVAVLSKSGALRKLKEM